MGMYNSWSKKNLFRFWILFCFLSFVVSGRTGRKMVRRRQMIPTFVEQDRNITVYQGETVVLRCTIKYLGPRTVVWRKLSLDYPLSLGKTMYAPLDDMDIDFRQVSKIKTRWDLVIKSALPVHSGTYECQISTKGSYTYHVQLNVIAMERPKEKDYEDKAAFVKKTGSEGAISVYGTQYINMYQPINLTCNASGAQRAPEAIDWFHNGHLIQPSHKKYMNRISIVNKVPEIPGRSLVSRLLIQRSIVDDQGMYVCRSSNLDTTSIMVHILNADKEITKRGGKDFSHSQSQPMNTLQNNGKCNMWNPRSFSLTFIVSVLVTFVLR